jgi:hypothetical protein
MPRSLRTTPACTAPLVVVALATTVLGACTRTTVSADAMARPLSAAAIAAMGKGPQHELRAVIELAHDYRDALLRDADYTDIASDECNAGWLRAFPRDTTSMQRDARAELVDKLEKLVGEYGTDAPLATAEGRDLLRVVIAWEASGEGPWWDVVAGRARRQAITPGLRARVRNPATGRCEGHDARDTTLFVLPAVPGVQRSSRAGAALRVVLGEAGLTEARDAFWRQRPADDATSRFGYTRIAASLLWKEYAVVTVHRPIERRGGVALDVGNGGGTYLFHRVGSEWRLLAIARTWG